MNGKKSTLELQHDRRRRRRLRQPNGIELRCDPMDSVVPDAVIEEGMKEGRKEAADDGGAAVGAELLLMIAIPLRVAREKANKRRFCTLLFILNVILPSFETVRRKLSS